MEFRPASTFRSLINMQLKKTADSYVGKNYEINLNKYDVLLFVVYKRELTKVQEI